MKKILSGFILLGALLFSNAVLSQCANFHKQTCARASEDGFTFNSQSRSGIFGKGMTSEMKVVLFQGMDYSISICNEKILGKEGMKFTLTDAKTGELIYDNSTDGGTQQIEFTCETTRNVLIKVTAPGAASTGGSDVAKAGGGSTKPKTAKAEDAGCVGVLIEQKPSQKVGF